MNKTKLLSVPATNNCGTGIKTVFGIVAIAIATTVMFSSCGGGSSVGAKFGKEFCDCASKLGKDADLSGLDGLGCILEVGEKYKEHLDSKGEFTNPKDKKDFIAAIKKCAPALAKELEEVDK